MNASSFSVDAFVGEALAATRGDDGIRIIEGLVRDAIADPEAVVRGMPESDEPELVLHDSPELTVYHIRLDGQVHVPPHNHGMQAVIGMYSGRELHFFYDRGGPGLVKRGDREIGAGEVTVMGPEAIHSVANPDAVPSGGIHVYLGDLPGIERTLWNPETFEEHEFEDELYFSMIRPWPAGQ